VLSVRLAVAALKNAAFEVACVPGYAFRSSIFEITAIFFFTGSSGLSEGDNPSSVSPPGGIQRVTSHPMGI
jgi:hypothetical protein